MTIDNLRKRLEELEKEFNNCNKEEQNYLKLIEDIRIRKQQLNGAYAEITKMIQDLQSKEKGE